MPERQLLPVEQAAPPIWGEHAANSLLDLIVFSKDRACQLDALLRSIRAFLTVPHRLHVLYTTSDQAFEDGYDALRLMHPGVQWVGEDGNFGDALRGLMRSLSAGPGRYLMFMVDDQLFTREFSAGDLITLLDRDEQILGVSLRLGEGTTYCYPRDIKTRPPDFSAGHRWAWRNASAGYWNYPMSLDGHIYRTSDIQRLLPELRLNGPNSFEASMAGRPPNRPDLVCEPSPCTVNIAANRVQSNFRNRSGDISPADLNTAFLEGQAIDAAAFAHRQWNSCHIEEDLPLVDDSRPRTAPAMERIVRQGVPHVRIDLREIPVFIINCPEDSDKRTFMAEQLRDLGLSYEFVKGKRIEPGWVGVALGHLKVLRLSRARVPFLVLEDDCQFNEQFEPVIDVPAAAEAVYLGVSTFGIRTPGHPSWGKHGGTLWQRHDSRYLRVFNMLARHAVLYLDEELCRAVIETQVEALTNRNLPHPGDMGLASLQTEHLMLTPVRHVCRQAARDVTDVDLATALPENEQGAQDGEAAVAKGGSSDPSAGQRETGFSPLCVISDKYRFVCVLIAKNASSTLRRELCLPRYEGREMRLHDIEREKLDSYFCIAFLRDPLSRAASAYQEISLRSDLHNRPLADKSFFDLDDGPERFRKFAEELDDGRWDAHTRPQADYVEGLHLDFCGRIETLARDFATIMARIGLEAPPVLPRRRSRSGRQRGVPIQQLSRR